MNNAKSDKDRRRLQELYMAFIDGEISDEEKRELDRLAASYPDVYKEVQQLTKVKELTMKIRLKEPSAEVWDKYWLNVYNRLERGIGWILFSVGAIVLIVYGITEFVNSLLADTEVQWWVKGAIFVLIAGVVVLLVSVVREKLFLYKSERYKDIKR